jgi:hypothetical protein
MHLGLRFTPLHARDVLARSNAHEAVGAARDARSEVEMLKVDVERLLMITEALWTMLREQHGYGDDELVARIAAIDMRDGRLDGKVSASGGAVKCPRCGRAVSKRRPVCIYCGTATVPDPFER